MAYQFSNDALRALYELIESEWECEKVIFLENAIIASSSRKYIKEGWGKIYEGIKGLERYVAICRTDGDMEARCHYNQLKRKRLL